MNRRLIDHTTNDTQKYFIVLTAPVLEVGKWKINYPLLANITIIVLQGRQFIHRNLHINIFTLAFSRFI